MPFTVCYYHVVWATKNRTEWLTNEVETCILNSIRITSTKLKCVVYALNACANHVHVAVDIRPQIAPSDWVGRVKGLSSFEVNKTVASLDGQFRWQKSYGLLTFGTKNLAFVVDYIERQKEHHAYGTLEPYLENTGEDE